MNISEIILFILPILQTLYLQCKYFNLFNISWILYLITLLLSNDCHENWRNRLISFLDKTIFYGMFPYLMLHSKFNNIYYYLASISTFALLIILNINIQNKHNIFQLMTCLTVLLINMSCYKNKSICILCT